jgi:hypothetical protein
LKNQETFSVYFGGFAAIIEAVIVKTLANTRAKSFFTAAAPAPSLANSEMAQHTYKHAHITLDFLRRSTEKSCSLIRSRKAT